MIAHDSEWDAGEMGCGELVVELRARLRALPAGATLRLRALDAGAPEDIPAWCSLTGNALVSAVPPTYWIQRKPENVVSDPSFPAES
jgi:tRNA 2-thiouridine synthesizing protein A